jgi:hypothetical protein
MKLGLQTLVIALVMVLAAVPAAFAGNGHGGGKPSWAGAGKPSWAGSGHAAGKASHEKKAKKPKHHQDGSTADDGTQSAGTTDLEGLNPAWYCKTLRDEMTSLESDFASMFGTNPNHANAFGKCVSRRAHGEDLSGAAGGDDQQDQQDTCDTTEPPATDGTDTTGAEDGGTDTTASDDEAGQDEGSDEEATDPEACSNDDSASDGPADDDEQGQGDDEQGEDDQGQDEGSVSDEGDSSDLAAALRFLRL